MLCPICRDTADEVRELEVFFELESVPVFCNVLHDTQERARAATRGDIHLGWCRSCGLIHNTAFDEARVEYVEGYENSLHCSPRFQSFAEMLAGRLIDKYDLHGIDVVEVGAHRGEFLELVCAGGRNRGIGYDPSTPEELCRRSSGPFELRSEYFDASRVEGPIGLIASRHVLEHIPVPGPFIQVLLEAAQRGSSVDRATAVYLEVPNGLWTLRDLGIWDIIYEHVSYFVPVALRRLFRDRGAEPHVQEVFGGQFLSAELPAKDDPVRDDEADAQDLEALARYVESFSRTYADRTAYWSAQLRDLAARDEGLAIWGAGSKGVTFLNVLARDPELAGAIRGVVDINPLKQGKYVSGTGHPIISPERLVEIGVERVIAMNPLYLQEIRSQLAALGHRGTVEAIQ
ncbi:MAG: methyltransferase [Planctomycetes bacterium]|nr:methyltransferase [Planctomycetota bacterium]